MGRDPDVDAWFEATDHPLKDVMLQVRREILAADRRVGECIKWRSPTFTYEGNIASIDPKAKAHVQLMFHQGAKLSRAGTRPWRAAAGPFATCASAIVPRFERSGPTSARRWPPGSP